MRWRISSHVCIYDFCILHGSSDTLHGLCAFAIVWCALTNKAVTFSPIGVLPKMSGKQKKMQLPSICFHKKSRRIKTLSKIPTSMCRIRRCAPCELLKAHEFLHTCHVLSAFVSRRDRYIYGNRGTPCIPEILQESWRHASNALLLVPLVCPPQTPAGQSFRCFTQPSRNKHFWRSVKGWTAVSHISCFQKQCLAWITNSLWFLLALSLFFMFVGTFYSTSVQLDYSTYSWNLTSKSDSV